MRPKIFWESSSSSRWDCPAPPPSTGGAGPSTRWMTGVAVKTGSDGDGLALVWTIGADGELAAGASMRRADEVAAGAKEGELTDAVAVGRASCRVRPGRSADDDCRGRGEGAARMASIGWIVGAPGEAAAAESAPCPASGAAK